MSKKPTRLEHELHLAATEELVLAGWNRSGAVKLAQRFGVTKRTISNWRARVLEDIQRRSRPGATQAESLDSILAKLEVVYERALADGKLSVARACLYDRARLLGLGAPTRVQVQAQIDAAVSIDTTPKSSRRDVSDLPVAVLEAVVAGAADGDLVRLLEASEDEPIEVEAVEVEAVETDS